MKIHHLQGYIQSIYLVEYAHGLLLLDSGSRADVTVLKTYIEQQLKRPFSDLKTVVVTHMHPDHAGGAHKLRDHTGCLIVSAQKNSHWYGGIDGFFMHLADIALTLIVASRQGKQAKYIWFSRKLRPDQFVAEGDRVPGFDEWTILETPGHTDRDLSVLHTKSKLAYVGDVVLKIKNVFISPFPIFHPNKYRQSLQRYLDLGLNKLLLAHGGEVQIHSSDLEKMIARAPRTPKTHFRFLRRAAQRYIPRKKNNH